MEPPVQAFWLPKLGNSNEEYEDASAYAAATGRFAIADGATESSYADRWARSLVEQFVKDPPLAPPACLELPTWLAPLQRQWHAGIAWDKLPWFAEEKARQGAFAAFLGLQFVRTVTAGRASWWSWFGRRKPSSPVMRWHALAVGDSCLFQVRAQRLVKAFPVEQAAAFNSRPVLLSSNPANNGSVWPALQLAEGDCHAGDRFILATDSLARWFLLTHEAGGHPWEVLAGVCDQASFAALVEKLRGERTLKNDDTTLLQFTWPLEPEAATVHR